MKFKDIPRNKLFFAININSPYFESPNLGPYLKIDPNGDNFSTYPVYYDTIGSKKIKELAVLLTNGNLATLDDDQECEIVEGSVEYVELAPIWGKIKFNGQ